MCVMWEQKGTVETQFGMDEMDSWHVTNGPGVDKVNMIDRERLIWEIRGEGLNKERQS